MNLLLRNSRIKLPLGHVFWREVGQGPVLVFLHGSWSDGSEWLQTIEQLSQDYHCCIPDLLGFGESERPKRHYSIQLEVECLLAYLKALHLPPVYLVGHSLGGWIAASYALEHWEQVRGLVLVAPEGVQEGRIGWGWARWLVGRPSIAAGVLRSLRPLARFVGRHKAIDQALQQRQQFLRSPIACKLLCQRQRSEIRAELLQERLDKLDVPTLILQGDRDRPNAIARSQTYAAKLPNAKLLMMEGGADLPDSLPSVVARHIEEFIQEAIANG